MLAVIDRIRLQTIIRSMDKPRLNAVDSGQFCEIARVGYRLDGPVKMTRARLGGTSLLAAGSSEPTDSETTDFLGGVTWEEFLDELQDPPKITQEN